MAYQIDRYNGTLLISVEDQTINTTATDIRLVGRNYAGYGEIQNENFLHLLENFANSSPPARPIFGQIWYDTVNKKLKFYDGDKFKTASGAEASPAPPAGLARGDFWWDTVNEQLYSWSGTEFILVGPDRAPTLGATSAIPQVVADVIGSNYGIIKLSVDGVVVGIVSNAQFNLSPVSNPIDGFFNIRRGINLRSVNAAGITDDHYFWGTASNADKLNGFTSDDFLRAGNTVFRSLIRFTDSGLTIGDQNDLAFKVANGNEIVIESTIGQPIIFRNTNVTEIRDIAIVRQDGIVPGSTDQYFLGREGIRWKEVNAETIKAQTFVGKLVGTIESPAPGSPGGPAIGQPIPPLALQTGLAVAGGFSMSGQTAGNFTVNLGGSTASVNLASGTVGSVDNFQIGFIAPGAARFTSAEIINTTEAANTTTAAFSVAGGAGVAKKLFVGGDLTVGGNGIFSGTGYVKVPTGTDLQRPIPAQQGMIRFNITDATFEGFDGLDWVQLAAGDAEVDYGFITTAEDTFVDYGDLL